MTEQERVLFVHAHPDDETISTGGTIATLVDRGAHVVVLTCTRGEQGEVIPADLLHLRGSPSALAAHRVAELREALAILGVTDHLFLGEEGARLAGRPPRRYTDSGMSWGPNGAQLPAQVPIDSLIAADFGEVTADIADAILQTRPDVVVSYDETGGYGHPDHVRASQAARRAAAAYRIPFYAIEPTSSSSQPSLRVDVSAVLGRKRAALTAHRSQVVVDGDNFALSNGVSYPIDTVEGFRRLRPAIEPESASSAQQSLPAKLLACLLAIALGLCVGAMLTVIHQSPTSIGGFELPGGLILGLLVVATALTGLRIVFDGRLVAGSTALGILVAIGVLSLRSDGGSVFVTPTVPGLVWSFGPALITLLVLGWPRLPARPRDKIVPPAEVKGSLHR